MQKDTSNKNFQLAADFVQYTNRSVFLTGKAGTGKTTFLKHIKETSNKNIAIVAPTGVAAINAGGVTIHSFFQLPFTPYIPVNNVFSEQTELASDKHQLLSKVKLNKERIGIIKKLELLIIDEISMVRCDVLDAIDQVLKHYRNQYSKPFGGLQVLLIGDMFQLPPVVKPDEWSMLNQYYTSPYFFDSQIIKASEPAFIELNKIYRQDDENFINLLNKVRNNNLDEEAFEILQELYKPDFESSKDEGFITLTTHNSRADAINTEALQSIPNSSFFFKASVENNFPESMFPIDEVLEFKLGAQVMFLKNDLSKEKRFFNGKIGTIEKISSDEIHVKCSDSNDLIKVEKYVWENIVYTLNQKNQQVEEEVVGTFTQFPLRLAWAITIHKSQGLTFDKAIIDAGKAFAPGQVYVALSRCRTLGGIVLVSKITSNSLYSDLHILQFSKQYKANQLEGSLSFEKHLHQNNILQDLFDFGSETIVIKRLEKFTLEQANSFNNATKNFIIRLKEKNELFYKYGIKFSQELEKLNDNLTLPESNEILQQRFVKAAHWYSNELNNFCNFINTSPALTNDKDNAKSYDILLKELFSAIQEKRQLLYAQLDGFSLHTYQKIKKEFVVSGFLVSSNAKKVTSSYRHATHPKLYDELRELRDEIAEQMNEESYMIAGAKTLEELATYLPQSKADLQHITGFGTAKIKNYGAAFLLIIINYCKENKIESTIHLKQNTKTSKPKTEIEPKKEKISTFEETFKLFEQGKNIESIAAERNMAVSTIENHFIKLIAEGRAAITEILGIDKTTIIVSKLSGFNKGDSLIPIKESLGDDYSFGEIKMVVSHLNYVNEKTEKIEN